jgi:hypothetical protein
MIHTIPMWAKRLPVELIVSFCWLLCLAVGSAGAVTVDLGALKDTTIFQNNPDNSAGGQTQFFSGTNSATSPRRALIAFDIAGSIPAGSTITSVDLMLTLSQVAGGGMGGGGGSPTIGLHEIGQNWGEGSVSAGSGQGSPASAGDATWNSAMHGSVLWAAAGGDFDPSASASQTIVGTTTDVSYIWASTVALVADVQGWLDNPSSNFGWLLRNEDETSAQTVRAFYSHEFGNPEFQPKLTVNYVPEPSAFLLGVFGILLSLTCFRRVEVALFGSPTRKSRKRGEKPVARRPSLTLLRFGLPFLLEKPTMRNFKTRKRGKNR